MRFMTMTGPYLNHGDPANGSEVEIYLGRFTPDMTAIEKWVVVSRNKRADFYPDAWIEPPGGERGTPAAAKVSDPAAAAGRASAAAPRSWPSDLNGLVFRWRNGSKGNMVYDQRRGATRSCMVEARGRARYGRNYDMEVAGGAFVAVEGTDELLAACASTMRREVGHETRAACRRTRTESRVPRCL